MAAVSCPKLLSRLLLQRAGRSRLWTALIALTVGVALLLVAVLLWWNFTELLAGKRDRDSLGATFLTISKRVTNENMGRPALTVFSPAEMEALKEVPDVAAVGTLVAVKERVNMSMEITPGLGFSTLMFLEAVPDPFMDRLPADWSWQRGQTQVPVILSSDFLSLYNYVFAPGQGLPQLSESSIMALPFRISIGPDGREEPYIGHVAGFSDRITSVLVPEAFARYANERSGGGEPPPSRLIVKVKDPSNTAFNQYLKAHDYVTNSEQLRLSKLRTVVQAVAGATGVLALLLMGVSVLVFVLFIELTVARAQQSVQLLLQLGYSPEKLGTFLYRKFLPLPGISILIAVVLAMIAQVLAAVAGQREQLSLPYFPGWPMWVVAAVCVAILLLQLRRAVRKSLQRV